MQCLILKYWQIEMMYSPKPFRLSGTGFIAAALHNEIFPGYPSPHMSCAAQHTYLHAYTCRIKAPALRTVL
jgi:hypothetical protein